MAPPLRTPPSPGSPVRHAKIIATLGPNTADPVLVASLVAAGRDVARLNASHGTAEQRAALIATLRAAAKAAGKPVPILLDLQGPRIRIGDLAHQPETLQDDGLGRFLHARRRHARRSHVRSDQTGRDRI